MCVIFACDQDKPSLNTLEMAEACNKDGGGIAWVENGKVKYKKGLTAKEIFDISQAKELPLVIHFRASSAGGVHKELCHPFPLETGAPLSLEGETDAALFHNGHVDSWGRILYDLLMAGKINKIPEGPISDTRVLALGINAFGMDFAKFFRTKIAILTKDKKIYIYNHSLWHISDSKIWQSSSIYNYPDIRKSKYLDQYCWTPDSV